MPPTPGTPSSTGCRSRRGIPAQGNLSPKIAWLLTRDFGAILASSRATEPSVILVREIMDLRPPEFVAVVVPQLELLGPHLKTGAIAAFTPKGIRVRQLPLR